MLLPAVSVTLIGLVAGLIFTLLRRSKPLVMLLLGVAGAWVGFLVGAVFGIAIDVISQSGVFVAILGHLMAIPGSLVSLMRFGN